jgi:hypothetical protein
MKDDPQQRAAKANRERLFSERPAIINEGEKRAATVRENMARLRELRLAKEAEVTRTEIIAANQPAKAKSKRRFR